MFGDTRNVSTKPSKGRCEGRKDHLVRSHRSCSVSGRALLSPGGSVTICPMTARVNDTAILLGGKQGSWVHMPEATHTTVKVTLHRAATPGTTDTQGIPKICWCPPLSAPTYGATGRKRSTWNRQQDPPWGVIKAPQQQVTDARNVHPTRHSVQKCT